MPRITYSITEARNQFSALIRRVEKEQQPIYITRYGQVVAVISPINEYKRLVAHQLLDGSDNE